MLFEGSFPFLIFPLPPSPWPSLTNCPHYYREVLRRCQRPHPLISHAFASGIFLNRPFLLKQFRGQFLALAFKESSLPHSEHFNVVSVTFLLRVTFLENLTAVNLPKTGVSSQTFNVRLLFWKHISCLLLLRRKVRQTVGSLVFIPPLEARVPQATATAKDIPQCLE